MYKSIVRPLLFRLSPETAHDLMCCAGRVMNLRAASRLIPPSNLPVDPRLNVEVAGIRFPNPVGVAAGLDKDAKLLGLWSALGFGHIEIGTVTSKPQPGNPKPRLFRAVRDRAVINRMGFPSLGADAVAQRLTVLRSRLTNLPPLGINIGKLKVTELEDAAEDLKYSFERLAPLVDYVAVNVSSPNTPGLRQLQERDRLIVLLDTLRSANKWNRPIFVKVSPDLPVPALEELIQCCFDADVAGIIATNTTLSREGLLTPIEEAGGLSGPPLRGKSLQMVRCIAERTRGRLAIIGVGGVTDYTDVLRMLGAGASMVQLYTALIYEGPGLVRRIGKDLVSYMDSNGCSSLAEASLLWCSDESGSRAAAP